jgi:hypothetical protein
MRGGEGNGRCLEQRSEGRHFELVEGSKEGLIKGRRVGYVKVYPEALIERRRTEIRSE